MRAILILCVLMLVGGGIWLWYHNRMPNTFGTFTGAPKVELVDLLNQPEAYLQKSIFLEDVIQKQCTTMGCFFFFVTDIRELKIDLADIAMHAPKKRNGKKARVEGRLVKEPRSYVFWASAVEFL